MQFDRFLLHVRFGTRVWGAMPRCRGTSAYSALSAAKAGASAPASRWTAGRGAVRNGDEALASQGQQPWRRVLWRSALRLCARILAFFERGRLSASERTQALRTHTSFIEKPQLDRDRLSAPERTRALRTYVRVRDLCATIRLPVRTLHHWAASRSDSKSSSHFWNSWTQKKKPTGTRSKLDCCVERERFAP